MSRKYQEENLRLASRLYNKGCTASEIGRLMGMSDRYGRELVRRTKELGLVKELTPPPRITSYDILDALREKCADIPIYKAKKGTGENGESLVILLTDLHFGAITKDENGNYIYNLNIASNRAKSLTEQILGLTKGHIAKSTKISHIAVLMAGDMIDGEGIFEGQSYTIEEAPHKQVMAAFKAVAGILEALKTLDLSIDAYCVKGNHGSIFKGSSGHWDLMLYFMLKTFTSGVNYHISEGDYINAVIQGWRYNIRHIGIGQVETAAGRAKVGGWSAIHDADVIVSGHLHHFSINENVGQLNIMGGALKGGDDFSESLAKGSAPSQLIWGCTPKHKISFLYPVMV